MENVFFYILAGILILLMFFISSLRERNRIARRMEDEIRETGAPAGPLPGPFPSFGAIIALELGAMGLFPFAGLPFAIAALVIAPGKRREALSNPILAPSLPLLRAAVAFATGGIAVTAVAAVNLALSAPDFVITPFLPEGPVPSENPTLSSTTIVMTVVLLVISAVMHEVGHGLAAYWSGDDTAKKAGRLTLNPLPHIDPLGSILVPAFLVALNAGFVIGWARPVPVRIDRLRDKRLGQAAVSSAGVAVNFTNVLALFAVFVAFGAMVRLLTPIRIENFTTLFGEAAVNGSLLHPYALIAQALKMGIIVNLALGIFNLVPIPPLDGANLLESFMPASLAPAFAAARAAGCLMMPLLLLLAFCLLLPVLLPVALLLLHVIGAFLVRM